MRGSLVFAASMSLWGAHALAADTMKFSCDIAAVQVKNLRVPIGYKTTATVQIDPSSRKWTLVWFDGAGHPIGDEAGALVPADDTVFTLKDQEDKTASGEGHTLQTIDRTSGAFVRDSRGKNAGVDVVLKQVGTCKPTP